MTTSMFTSDLTKPPITKNQITKTRSTKSRITKNRISGAMLLLLCGAIACAEGNDEGMEGGTEGFGDETGATDGSASSPSTPSTSDPTSDSGSPLPGGTSGVTTGDETGAGGEAGTDGEMTDGGDGSTGGEPAALDCMGYCDIYMDACSDYSEYANMEHCLDHCAQWPLGSQEDIAGDSLGCRTYHVTVASGTDPALHCPHSGPSGDGVCVDQDAPDCDLYCSRYFNNCTGDLNVYADMADCVDQCAPWYAGTIDDDSGNTIGCRAYYAGLAAAAPQDHCPNAGPGGGEQCTL